MRPRVRNTIAFGLGGGAKQPRGPAGEVSPTDDESEAWLVPDLTILQTARHDPPPLPVRAIFGDAWGQWIEAASEGKGAPCDYVAGALLAVAGSLIGNSRWAHPYGDWREPPVIWSKDIAISVIRNARPSVIIRSARCCTRTIMKLTT